MSNDKQELVENIDKYSIGIDDTFAFKCRHCGKCCKNRDDVLLNARDVFNIAKKLNLTTIQVIEKYCNTYIGHDSRLPIVQLKFGGNKNACPLMNDERCSVHSMKPTICALYPLGRIAKLSDNPDKIEAVDIGYIIQPVTCGSISRKQTVRDWLESFSIPIEDEFYLKWSGVVLDLSTTMREFEQRKITKGTLDMMRDAIGTALYAAYDTNREFMPQFTVNSDKILNLFKTFEQDFQATSSQ